jgi:hypothetical protein
LEKKNNYYQDIRRVKISVIIATKQFYWKNEDESVVQIKKIVQDIMEWKSDSSCSWSDYSICGILDNIQCIVDDWCVLAQDLYINSIQYYDTTDWFVWYRSDLTLSVFNMNIPRS